MIRKFLRLLKISRVAVRYGLDNIAISGLLMPRTARLVDTLFFWRDISAPRGERLRLALEELGPIFVKFGQVLSTRRDLMPPDIADELARLQDRVPPFDSDLAIAQIKKSLGAHPNDLFAHFERDPVASASIAQVHFARLKDGTDVAVKVLRPGMKKSIDEDVALMHLAASMVEKFWADGKRLKPREVVGEFDKYLHDELDLMREAANGSQLRRNFADSTMLMVPEMYWDYCSESVIVMERMRGIPISRTDRLVAAGVDMKKLSRDGVEIFFTQVFRDGFFHGDMHPGNILVSVEPATLGRYIALDFGIVGTLTDFDKDYRKRLGAGRHPGRRARIGGARLLRTDLRPAAARHFLRPGAAAPVPDLAPLQRRGPAAAGAAAKDVAQHRRPGPSARSRPRPLENRQAVSGALDERAGRLARPARAFQGRGAALQPAAAATAAPDAPGPDGAVAAAQPRARRPAQAPAGRAETHQSVARFRDLFRRRPGRRHHRGAIVFALVSRLRMNEK
jgi:hypothetical protein